MERWANLQRALEGLRQQTRQPDEIIVICDHSPTVYAALVELGVPNIYENHLSPGISNARNAGLDAANGDILAFLDDDAYPEEDWLEELVAPIESDPDIFATGGWVIPEGGNVPAWYPKEFYWVFGCSWAGLAGRYVIRNPIGASMAWRRSTLKSIGGFPSDFGRAPGRLLGGPNSVGGPDDVSYSRSTRPNTCDETLAAISASDQGFVVQVETSIVHHHVARERTTLKYLLTRCWGEGISKAYVQQLSRQPLHEEAAHGLRILRNLSKSARRPNAWRTISFSLLGLASTMSGFFYARTNQVLVRGRRFVPMGLLAEGQPVKFWKSLSASSSGEKK